MKADEISKTQTPQAQKRRKEKEKQRKRELRVGGKRLLLSRFIAVTLLFALVAAGVWFFTQTQAAETIAASVAPIWDPMVAFVNDPLGIDWGGILYGIAFILISYIGIIHLLFERR